jgi:hypothetical protein
MFGMGGGRWQAQPAEGRPLGLDITGAVRSVSAMPNC